MITDTRPARPSGNTGLWWKLRHAAERTFGRRAGAPAERLSRAAGSAAGSSDGASCFEALEQRQLLAIVTIPPSSVNPQTGLGVARGWFDYIAPYVFKVLPDPMAPAMPTVEEFNDENDPWSMADPSRPPNGAFFSQSAFRIAYQTQAANGVHLLRDTVPGTTGQGDPAMDRDLYVNLQGSDQVTFEFRASVPQGGMAGTPPLRLSTNVTITFRTGPVNRPATTDNYANDGDTIKTGMNGTQIELLRNGVVVQSFSGAALAALLTNVPDQGGSRSIAQIQFEDGFDSFRIRAANQIDTLGYNDQFLIDDIRTTFPTARFAQFVESRRFSAQFVFSGPAGASVQLLDLYGREIVLTTFLGIRGQDPLPVADANGDGVPDLNDGIGRLNFSATNARTSFTMIGGAGSTQNQNGGTTQAGPPTDLKGILNELEMAGFGFALTNATPPAATGLPSGTGSFLLGSPIVRDNSSPGAYLGNGNGRGDALDQITPANFNRADQGIFTQGTIGSLLLHAAVFGSSQIRGSVQSLNTGVQLGSINVAGDAGTVSIASDAGIWQPDDITGLDPRVPFTRGTGAQIIVGRTIGELLIGGRTGTAVQVLADINNPARPPLSFIDYSEREVVYAFNPQTNPMIPSVYQALLNSTVGFRDRLTGTGQATIFGDGLFRNDNLQNAEYIGYNGTAVRIHGNLGARDPVNSEDFTDAFAFAADPTREVVIQGSAGGLQFNGYVRVVDRHGLTVAAFDLGAAGRGRGGNARGLNVLRFRPDHADVYYLVLNEVLDANFFIQNSYDITLSGLAPTTAGALTTGAGVGERTNALIGNQNRTQFLFTLNAGSMGLVRVGVGVTGADAALHSPAGYINTNLNTDDLLDFGFSSITVPVNVYGVVAGSDILGANITVGRDLGTLVTGLSPLVAGGNREGDLTAADIRTGGKAGIFDISGAIGADQDPDMTDSTAGQVSIRTGTRGGGVKGDIGQILVGAYVIGDNLTVETAPGSTIDQFLVLDGPATEIFGPNEIRGSFIPRFTTGIGSDVRFTDFGLIQRAGDANLRISLAFGQVYTFVDDAGASFTISITGGTAPASTTSGADVYFLPIDGSQGVAVSRIVTQLNAGANLNITATGTAITGEAGSIISIGRIIINGDADAASSVLITDSGGVQAEIDVWRIDGLKPLAAITNTTHGRNNRAGDIVAIDAVALNRVSVSGNLGLTDTTAGPSLLGPFLGIAGSATGTGAGGMPGDPLPVSHLAIDRGRAGGGGDDWDGTAIFVPVQVTDYNRPNTLEDVGSPIDPYLNGVIVRNGDLADARADGALGDVLVAAGDLINAMANADGARPFGAFQGVVGSIYAYSINTIDIGDGLRGAGASPFARAGIFANNDIAAVNATRVRGALIEGVILAADEDGAPSATIGAAGLGQVVLAAPIAGLGTLTVAHGTVDGAFIQSVALDDWWNSLRVQDNGYIDGNIAAIILTDTSLLRSEVQASTVGPITITGGVYDSTTINAIVNVVSVTADAFLNSSVLGRPGEVHANSITSSRDVGSITTTGLAGDVADLNIDILGTLTGRIAGRNLLRLSINVANVINELTAAADIKAISVVSGRVRTMMVGGNLRNTQLLIAGPIDMVSVGNEITGLMILSSGPDGRIGTIRASGRIDADISSSGPVTMIESVTSDVSGRLATTDVDGNIGILRAGRDILLDALITGSVTTVTAARNVGRAADGNDRALDIQGNLGSLTAGGQIFSDILVGQSVTGMISSGRVAAKPGNDRVGVGDIRVFGRINALSFSGDVNGDITSYSGGIGTITITGGSFRKGHAITALDGSIDSITITSGDLLGDVHADGDLTLLQLLAGPERWKSSIGIARFKSSAGSYDSFRNQLPPDTIRTAASDGPRITAGHDIGRIFLQNGSIWESTIVAGRTVRDITVAAGGFANDELTTAQGSSVVGGDRVEKISAATRSDHLTIAAGITDLGDNGVPGGLGSAADTVKEGSIGTIDFSTSGSRNILISAGLNAGGDGVYNTADDLLAPGLSAVTSVNLPGAVASSIYADGPVGSVTRGAGLRVVASGQNLAAADPSLLRRTRPAGSLAIPSGQTRVFTLNAQLGQKFSVTFTGPGNAWFDAANHRIVLLNTNSSSSLLVTGRRNNADNAGAPLTNLSVIGSNNATLGSLTIRAILRGLSTVFIDGGIGALALARTTTTGIVGSGGDIGSFSVTRIDSGSFTARAVQAFTVSNTFLGGRATFLDLGTLRVVNTFSGTVSSDHNIGAVTLGPVNLGRVRSGGDIGPVTTRAQLGGLFSARDRITSVTVAGDAVDSAIYAGVDLGRDANFGGSGPDADTVSNGSIGTVTVSGAFPRSDVSAGVARGSDGFLGTADDVAADGRSSIGPITIGGRNFGSSINSEQYRVISTGSVAAVTADGSAITSLGNFAVRQLGALPEPVRVTDLNVFEDSRIYRAEFRFNQPIDASTFAAALSIAEVRNSGATLVGLAQGSDYTVRYNAATNIATVTFSTAVSNRNLPQAPGIPGPGLFRFVLSGALFRGASQGVFLDGNGDGTTGDDFSEDAVVGDAGDKITPGSNTLADGTVVDFYPAADLNLLLDSNYASDNNPDVNRVVNLRGTIGDHPDSNSNLFRAGGDVDLYRISLRAGQVLVLGQVGGSARNAVRAVFDSAGMAVSGGGGAFTVLPATAATDAQATPESQFLVNTTGTYFIAVAASLTGVDIADPTNVPNNDPVGGAIGSYNFNITVVDDGNTGFNGDTDSGDGAQVINAPVPLQFAGGDQRFGTGDDTPVFSTGRFNFKLDTGPDGRPNTRDDVVTGSDGGEIVSTRRSGPDGVWGNTDDEVRAVATSAIGLPGAIGVPSQVSPDSDVYRLNGGQPIAPGTRVRFTFKLTDSAGNIGLASLVGPGAAGIATAALTPSLLGDVKIGLFEVPAGAGFSDAKLVASPSEFVPIGGQRPVTHSDGVNSYGYNADGDFFMEIVLPGSQEVTGFNVPASYALYVQGAIRSDYTLDILTQGSGVIQRSRQNVLLETRGGVISWLEAGGITTDLDAFNSSVLGFAGQINGVDVDDYITDSLISSLNAVFTAANVDITVSNDASTFEGSDFSTVFLAGNTEPNAFFNDGTFGASQHVDMLNIDKNDQAVVFTPSLAQLGNAPDQAGVDNLVRALTAAVGRRIGELIGLRATDPSQPGATASIMASNSVLNNPGPGGTYAFINASEKLSGLNDTAVNTNFYLGAQNSLQLIQRILRPRA